MNVINVHGEKVKDHSKFDFAKTCSTQGSKCIPKFSSQYNVPANP